MLADTKPLDYKAALCDKKWKEAIIDELKSIEKNKTWEPFQLLDWKKAIDVKWVFKFKLNPDGKIVNQKARLVARGFL